MNTRNAAQKLIIAYVLATALLGVAIAQERTSRSAQLVQNNHPTPPLKCAGDDCHYFGAVGLTRGQTARLNAYDKSTVDNPVDVNQRSSVNDVPPGPCRKVELMFIDSLGMIRQHSTQCLMRGHAVFFDLNGNTLEMMGFRTEIRALVSFVEDPDESNPRTMKLGATLEVFDNETGRTSFVLYPAVQNTWAGR